ncbi:hypothetical protein FAIPA1_20414 [Frankia sp. AiPs1]
MASAAGSAQSKVICTSRAMVGRPPGVVVGVLVAVAQQVYLGEVVQELAVDVRDQRGAALRSLRRRGVIPAPIADSFGPLSGARTGACPGMADRQGSLDVSGSSGLT